MFGLFFSPLFFPPHVEWPHGLSSPQFSLSSLSSCGHSFFLGFLRLCPPLTGLFLTGFKTLSYLRRVPLRTLLSTPFTTRTTTFRVWVAPSFVDNVGCFFCVQGRCLVFSVFFRLSWPTLFVHWVFLTVFRGPGDPFKSAQ